MQIEIHESFLLSENEINVLKYMMCLTPTELESENISETLESLRNKKLILQSARGIYQHSFTVLGLLVMEKLSG